MQALGGRAALAFTAEPDIKEWADRVALNPARVPPGPQLTAIWRLLQSASASPLAPA